MIVTCPGCHRRYRIDAARMSAGPRRLRCAGCGKVFAVEPSNISEIAAQPSPQGGGPAPGPAREAPRVLVADEDREFRDLVCRTLTELGCQVSTAEDGESALRLASQNRPYLVVLNVYLRKLLGVAVCEGIKGNPGLRSIRVALVGSVFKSERFVRGPRHLYGADDYFEDVISKPDMRERFRRLLSGTGSVPTSARATSDGGGAVSSAGREHVGHAGGTSVPDQSLPASHGGHDIEPRAEIRRLARIMLSDLKIYYPERFGRAVAERRLFEAFREELIKGKELIVNRFPELPDRLEILAVALREGLEEERSAGRARSRGTGT